MPARPQAVAEPLPAGWVRVDCHLHTARSGDAVMTLDELEQRVEHTGLDVVCITDHHAIAAAVEAVARDLGARVIVGEEIRTAAGEVIGLFLAERIPYVLPLEEVIGRIRAQGGVVYAPHPCDPVRSSLGAAALEKLCSTGLLDVVEGFNAKVEDDGDNDRAAAVAARYGVPLAAGSDAHDAAGVGAAFVEMREFDGPADFVDALKTARLVGEHRPHALRFSPPSAFAHP